MHCLSVCSFLGLVMTQEPNQVVPGFSEERESLVSFGKGGGGSVPNIPSCFQGVQAHLHSKMPSPGCFRPGLTGSRMK